MSNPFAGIVGTDKVSPVHNKDALYQRWAMSDIYKGGNGAGKYIPKVGDIIDDVTGRYLSSYVVVAIDPVTGVAQYELLSSLNAEYDLDILIGATGADTYRMYLDTSTTPATLDVDARLAVFGNEAHHCKIFKGTDVSSTGVVISRVYDANMNAISENISLETAAINDLTGNAVKCVRPAHCNVTMATGDVVTAVIYSVSGRVLSKRRLIVENTKFVRSNNAEANTVEKIYLTSPYIASEFDRQIQIPLGMTLDSLGLMCNVVFRDGRVERLAIDGTKVQVYGLTDVIASVVGEHIPVVVKYKLSASEVTYAAGQSNDGFFTEVYDGLVGSVSGAYSLKLYCYPEWISASAGYSLRWWLYNQDRNMRFDATASVKIDINYNAFSPKAYGTLQRLAVSVNLRDVDPAYPSYIHAQTIDVVLGKEGTERMNNWLIGYSTAQSPKFGKDTYATVHKPNSNSNIRQIVVSSGFTNQTDWLNALYWRTLPQFDTINEVKAPTPNFFAVIVKGVRYEFALSDWDSTLLMDIPAPTVSNSTTYLQFFKRTNVQDLHLAIAGLPTYGVDASGNFA